MTSDNLMPTDRLIQKRSRNRLRVWITLCSVYATILVASFVVCYLTWGRNGAAITNELEATVQKTRESTRLIAKLRHELTEVQAALEASRAMGDQPDWSILLALLAKELGDEVVLDHCRLICLDEGDRHGSQNTAISTNPAAANVPLGQRRYELSLGGFGRTQTAVSRFVLRLEHIELFGKVKLTKCNRQPFLAGEAVAFRIQCLI